MADLQARTRSLDPARQAYAQARAGLPVTVCPFCGGPPNYAAYHRGQGVEIPLCCCVKCYDPATCVPGGDPDRRCLECPHRLGQHETHLWWVVRPVQPVAGLRFHTQEVLAVTAYVAACEAVADWLDTCDSDGEPKDSPSRVVVEVTPHAKDAADDPYRCYERAGGGRRFTLKATRRWIVEETP